MRSGAGGSVRVVVVREVTLIGDGNGAGRIACARGRGEPSSGLERRRGWGAGSWCSPIQVRAVERRTRVRGVEE